MGVGAAEALGGPSAKNRRRYAPTHPLPLPCREGNQGAVLQRPGNAMTHELRTGGDRGYKRIATEEAFATREQIDGYLRIIREGKADRGVTSLWGFYAQSPSERATTILERLLDLGDRRIADMDATGIDVA